MNAKYLDMMNAEELEDYAQILGTTKAAKTKAASAVLKPSVQRVQRVEIFGINSLSKKKFTT